MRFAIVAALGALAVVNAGGMFDDYEIPTFEVPVPKKLPAEACYNLYTSGLSESEMTSCMKETAAFATYCEAGH